MNVWGSDQQGDQGVYGVGLKVTELGWIYRPQPLRDIGIDAQIEVVENNKSTAELIALQIKSGDSWFKETNEQGIVFRGDIQHLEYWQNYPLPIIVVLYDSTNHIAYWQVVNTDTVINTGKGWKLIIPFNQKLDKNSETTLKEICKSIFYSEIFEILSVKNVSHAKAKRYTANILVYGQRSKADIISVIRQVTKDLTSPKYYIANSPAQVIYLFLYIGLEDVKIANWICHSQWIDEKLESHFRPMLIEGFNIGDGIIAEWSKKYEDWSNWFKKDITTKQKFLEKTRPIIYQIKKTVEEISQLVLYYDNTNINYEDFIRKMGNFEIELSALYHQSIDIGNPTLECKDFAQRFYNVMAYAHNITIPFSEQGLKTWNENNSYHIIKDSIKDYEREILRLEYELEKL
ncbi:DUF4365 domain-containing protein [Okeanomitos corallinicola TIOX110]|uniref:DUF4365 domain-containing protein n=1 Tax=Okeanomitos corallinicola TIOX110 TaxID=3133117 RepID=A0ABZ2UVX5_9CYAN